MEKNVIITNFSNSLVDSAVLISSKAANLNDDMISNESIIATLNVLVESLRSQTILLQNALDEYK